MKIKQVLFGIIVLCQILLFSSCAPTGDSNSYKNTLMNFAAVQSVAVLPFHNLTSDDDAAERVRDTFMGMLLATEAMYVLPPGEVERGIERASLRDPAKPTIEKIKSLGQILQVDAVITGVLREYGQVRSGQTQANLISVSVRMMEVETGNVVWSGDSTKGGISVADRLLGGGGAPMNQVTKDAINDLLDQLFQ
ncbi:GNA1162 family protein [uncultured Desulfuromusa sp.]|uniref:GNA1162 family protein n=1 Tax=uncultured Desulfuromusa sp. TaxID=219183 RepID=UPI002AA8E2FF|nr:GNA1162 family protein [uncultured Desulfuromusa sp.]